jgi:hypothetical protein
MESDSDQVPINFRLIGSRQGTAYTLQAGQEKALLLAATFARRGRDRGSSMLWWSRVGFVLG